MPEGGEWVAASGWVASPSPPPPLLVGGREDKLEQGERERGRGNRTLRGPILLQRKIIEIREEVNDARQ